MTNLKKVHNFYKNKHKIKKIILSRTDKHEIIHGARAINKQVSPSYLDTPTTDFDIFSKKPKKDAKETEKALDKEFGGDYFYVKKGRHKGTWKVKSKVNEQTYADYTKPNKKIPSKTINKLRYARLNYLKQHILKTLKDPKQSFRHAKDKDALNRILVYERLKKQIKLKTKGL